MCFVEFIFYIKILKIKVTVDAFETRLTDCLNFLCTYPFLLIFTQTINLSVVFNDGFELAYAVFYFWRLPALVITDIVAL